MVNVLYCLQKVTLPHKCRTQVRACRRISEDFQKVKKYFKKTKLFFLLTSAPTYSMHSKTPAVEIPNNPKKVKDYFKVVVCDSIISNYFQRNAKKTPEHIYRRYIPGVFVTINKQKEKGIRRVENNLHESHSHTT